MFNDDRLSGTLVSSSKFPKRDWMYSIQLNRWLLKPIGAWPLSFSLTIADKIVSIGLTTISSFLIGFLLVPCALCTLLDRGGDLDTKIKMIGPMSFCVMAAVKYYILVSRGKAITKCIGHIRLDWEIASSSEKDREIVLKNAEFGRSLVILCAAFMYGGGFFYCTVMPLCSTRIEIIDNETIRAPSFPIYRKLIDPRSTPYFEIVQFFQCLAGYVIYSITISACSLAAVFVMHACGQFRILMNKLDDLVTGESEGNDQVTSDKRMGIIVEYHLRILSFISKIEKLFNEICFVELVGCTLNICFLGYYLMTEWERNEPIGTLTYCTLLVSFIFNIFILCYIGEILAEQCKNVGMTSYMMEWYRLPKKKALGLTLVIAVSNSPVKLTAGKLFELSLTSFCSVLFAYIPVTALSTSRSQLWETLSLLHRRLDARTCANRYVENPTLPMGCQSQLMLSFCRARIMYDDRPPSSSKLPEKDWLYSLELNRWFLKPIGAWPFSFSVTIVDKIISIGLTTISGCLIGFLLIPCALCAILDREGDINAKIKMIGPLSFCIMAAIKYCILIYRGKDIAKCIQHVKLDWERASYSETDRKIVLKNAKFGRSLVILCAVFMYGGGVFFCTVMPLCATRTEIIDNVTIRIPSFPIYRKLIDPRSSPYFEIVQFFQCLAGYVIYTVTISACSLAAVFVMHACGQFRILMSKLDLLVAPGEQKCDPESTNKRIGEIVEYHLRILGFVFGIEELFNEICFVEFVGCTLNICFLGYQLMTEWEHNETVGTLTFCTLLVSFTFNIFILCYIGELIVDQCTNIATTSYMMDWYRLPNKKALGLTLVIAVSNSPIKLTAGKIFELSLTSFCSVSDNPQVVKSAVAYLSLLRTLDSKMYVDSAM